MSWVGDLPVHGPTGAKQSGPVGATSKPRRPLTND